MESNQIMDINSPIYEHMVLDKEAKIIQWKNETSSINDTGIVECQYVEECK